ncbi:carboxypeptidase regulatory-like domain-containing protein [Natrarchaeobius halalkaliphilus]|uniref:Carboxypeptidase regulatory-like domain-containing protein n=1 Tax=Natrarchaeobius halalkaliphilus TaxID=1679091 RepID=A0A3N6M3J0_9EURY|nr:carboxypeptidase regulatory-like domain-containing protein [Natrarchaeobius halalkaliphilus]RQG89771.1 carboxypeptidase regulatory-like domain-containing protein [Natrarchaeobius halalkaliphilus]
MRTERDLILEIDRRETTVETPLTVRVRDRENRPIEDAIVSVGTQRRRTDSAGRCEITIRSPGFWKLTATRRSSNRVSYRPTAALVRAVSRATPVRRTHRLPSR